ncbi:MULTISPECIES: hypothetical protein [Paenibacillus]|uniref:hypothetical protein n=1 Tax=Paenibacillus TaxID=44249 RepID=UPI000369102F|nr:MULTISPECIES: hypothetical protein [Paenibacillus]
MKIRNIAVLSALSLAVTLTAAPTGFASSVSPDVTVNNPAVSSQDSISINAVSGPYPVGGNAVVVPMRGELAVTVSPARYATFNLKVTDLNTGSVVANQAYSGSSPYTFRVSNNSLVGNYSVSVTSSTGGSNGTFTLSYL